MRDAKDVLGLLYGVLEASLAHFGAVGASKRLRFQHRGRVPEAVSRGEKRADLQRQIEYKHNAVESRRMDVQLSNTRC